MHTHESTLIRGSRTAFLEYKRRMLLGLFNFFSGSTLYRPPEYLREKLLFLLGLRFASAPSIGDNLYILKGANLSFGKSCIIGHYCRFYDWYPIKIGNSLFCSNQLTVVSASHDSYTYKSMAGPVSIGENVWIGINVTIVGPVTIGNNVVIGAGSVVLKDIPDNAIAAGVPARVLRIKNTNEANYD